MAVLEEVLRLLGTQVLSACPIATAWYRYLRRTTRYTARSRPPSNPLGPWVEEDPTEVSNGFALRNSAGAGIERTDGGAYSAMFDSVTSAICCRDLVL